MPRWLHSYAVCHLTGPARIIRSAYPPRLSERRDALRSTWQIALEAFLSPRDFEKVNLSPCGIVSRVTEVLKYRRYLFRVLPEHCFPVVDR